MPRPFPTSWILLPAVALAGCVSYEPDPLDPAKELAALRTRGIPEVELVRSTAGPLVPRGAAFDPADGLDEAELVAVALTLNPELRARRLEAGEARAALIQAGLWPNPEVGLSVARGLESGAGTTVDFDFLFELLRGAERSARIDAATAKVEEVRAGIVAEEWRLAAEVRRQRLAVLAAEREVSLLGEEAALRERTRETVRRRRDMGEGTEVEVAASDLEVAEVRRETLRAEGEVEAARRELARLLGLPPGYALRIVGSGDPLPVEVLPDVPEAEIDRRLLAGRPDLKALEAAYKRAEHELRLAVERQYPHLNLGPLITREDDGAWHAGPSIGLELPLFDRNQGEIAEKEAQRARARAEYVAALQRARAEAMDALGRMRRVRTELDAFEKEVLPLVQRTQDLAERAFRAGEVGVLDWITAQQRALTTRKALLESAVRYRAAALDFEAAVGPPPEAIDAGSGRDKDAGPPGEQPPAGPRRQR
ncbi:MAG: TolC family protein [Planctomycetaceae bacterium]|nr:TolC family protein [Planctomycetota bacterium]NUN51198.1 TolC family protein [Planctomycetaceae bacterium]